MTESSFRRMLLRFALLPIACLFAFLAFLGVKLHQITVTRTQAARATTMLLESDRVLQTVLDEETGVRGYLAAKDALFLEPYHQAAERIGAEFSALEKDAGADPELTRQVAATAASLKQFDTINQQLLARGTANSNAVALLKQQKQTVDTLRAQLGELIREETELRESRRETMNSLYDRLPALAISGGVVIAILLIWHGTYLFRGITRAFRLQLNESELQRDSLRTTLHSIGDAVIVCDKKGSITLLNPTAEQLTGWSSQDAIGQPLDIIFEIIHEHSRVPVESPVARVLRSGQVVGLANHTLLVRKDKTTISIDDSGAPIRDRNNEIAGVVLVFRDIEERRRAERELELRTSELESALFHSTAGFASFDHEHRYVRVNRAMAQINGVSVEDHLGKAVREIVPVNAPSVDPIIDEVFRTRVAIQQEIIGETDREPGVERQWLTCFYPVLTGRSEEPVLVGVIALETTDRWRAQESLLRSEKLAAVGRLAASIAHEMNNPLASVTNLLYLLEHDAEIQGQSRDFVERANIELARVSHIARQTLRFAKRSAAPTAVDLNEVAASVLLLFSGRINLNFIQVSTRIKGTPSYQGHANEVMQVLTNLVGNALDAVKPQSRLTVAAQKTTNWETGEAGIAITVADSGPGIPVAWRTKIWEPFFTTKPETGTGLGLWLVDEMVKKNGGSIRFRTATKGPRMGTTLRIFLPHVSPSTAD